MKVLVTGGAGNVGRTVSRILHEAGHDVVIFDMKEPAEDVGEYIKGSITNPEAVDNAADGCEAIVHLAAIPAFKPDIPAQDFMLINVVGTSNVVEAAGKHGVKKFVMASSDSALGFVFCTHPFSPQSFPIDEAHPLKPQDPYGLSKLLGEEITKAGTRKYGLQATCLRFCWVWFEDTYQYHRGLLREPAENLARTMWGYLDVRDAAQACRLAIEKDNLAPHETFFITAADTYMDRPSLELIATHYPEVAIDKKSFEEDPYRSLFDLTRARHHLGYKPRYRWRDLV